MIVQVSHGLSACDGQEQTIDTNAAYYAGGGMSPVHVNEVITDDHGNARDRYSSDYNQDLETSTLQRTVTWDRKCIREIMIVLTRGLNHVLQVGLLRRSVLETVQNS